MNEPLGDLILPLLNLGGSGNVAIMRRRLNERDPETIAALTRSLLRAIEDDDEPGTPSGAKTALVILRWAHLISISDPTRY
jgi:hypothetical protein